MSFVGAFNVKKRESVAVRKLIGKFNVESILSTTSSTKKSKNIKRFGFGR